MVLEARRVTGAVLIGILVVTFISMGIGLTPFAGCFLRRRRLRRPLCSWISPARSTLAVSVIFAFLFVDVFDNTGTLLGVTKRAGLADEQGNVPKMGRALIADSAAALFGSLLGTSTTTSYVSPLRASAPAAYRSDGDCGRHSVPAQPVLLATGGSACRSTPRRQRCCSLRC